MTVVSARHLSAALGGRHIPSVDRRGTPRLSARVTCCCVQSCCTVQVS